MVKNEKKTGVLGERIHPQRSICGKIDLFRRINAFTYLTFIVWYLLFIDLYWVRLLVPGMHPGNMPSSAEWASAVRLVCYCCSFSVFGASWSRCGWLSPLISWSLSTDTSYVQYSPINSEKSVGTLKICRMAMTPHCITQFCFTDFRSRCSNDENRSRK